MAIRGQYEGKNPYHNWTHALEVAQCTWHAVLTGGRPLLNYQDILALYCAAIAHDVGHYGFTTPFLVRTQHEIAVLYNDKSPMENMHAYIFFTTMLGKGNTFLQVNNESQWKNFRRKVITAILSTDIAHHFGFVDKLQSRVARKDTNPFMEDAKIEKDKGNVSKEDRILLLEAFMHTADLTHNFKPFNVHKIGLTALEDEWFLQGDEERKRGMPISPNFDRTKDTAATCQSFFLGSMVRPLLVCFHHFMAQEYADNLLLNLDTNKKCWEKAIKVHGKHPVSELVKVLPETWGTETRDELVRARIINMEEDAKSSASSIDEDRPPRRNRLSTKDRATEARAEAEERS